MANQVRLHDSYIELLYIGDQSYQTVHTMVQEGIDLARKNWGDSPLFVLADLNRLGKSTFSSREETLRALRNVNFKRIAIFAGSVFIRHLAQLVVRAAGMADKVRVFTNRQEAVRWLMEGASNSVNTGKSRRQSYEKN